VNHAQQRPFLALPCPGAPTAFVCPSQIIGFTSPPDRAELRIKTLVLTGCGSIPTSLEIGAVLDMLSAVTGVNHVLAAARRVDDDDEPGSNGVLRISDT
jgi:hypothetical protein